MFDDSENGGGEGGSPSPVRRQSTIDRSAPALTDDAAYEPGSD